MASILQDATQDKESLIRLLSGALIKEPSFETAKKAPDGDPKPTDADSSTSDASSCDSNDAPQQTPEDPLTAMLRLGTRISESDGEFLLKLAIYLRQDLGIRGSANFITSIAAFQPACQPFLSAYLPKIISLPSDWLQIASFARDSPLRVQCGLPTSLRKALCSSFTAFNEFSLAKYNTESAQRKRKKDRIAKGEAEDDIRLPYTLKQMIRMLHIAAPRFEVMCLLGKPYPPNAQAFLEMGLATPQRAFDPDWANRRMRLPIPRTWETDLASKGNHAHVWEALVADRKLPFMAMLRNLRNIILAGCNRQTHTTILQKLRDEDQIANSKQFPYRFFSAFDVLTIDPATAYDAPQVKREGAPTKAKPKPPTAPTPEQLASLLDEYQLALEESVRLATKLNIRPIHGKSIVILHANTTMLDGVKAQGAKGIGSVRTKLDVALLLAMMLQHACESCEFVVFCDNDASFHRLPSLDRSCGMLQSLRETKERIEALILARRPDDNWASWEGRERPSRVTTFPYAYLDHIINAGERIESILLVGDQHRSYQEANAYPILGFLPQYLQRLRQQCNPDLLFVALAIDGSASESGVDKLLSDPNDVLLTGFSDSILRFIAERSGGGPRRYIEHIDRVYHVDTSQVRLETGQRAAPDDSASELSDDDEWDDDATSDSDSACSDDDAGAAKQLRARPLPSGTNHHRVEPVPAGTHLLTSYRHARWFISSTFLDMQCERDALAFHVFPALRAWIAKRGFKVHITPIDFRWGIDTEGNANCTPVSVCLNEVSRCAPFVVGLLGGRSGGCNTVARSRIVPDDDVAPSDFAWLADAPNDGIGMPITAMEMHHALHCCSQRRVQHNATTPRVAVLHRMPLTGLPANLQSTFGPESNDAVVKMRQLLAAIDGMSARVLKREYTVSLAPGSGAALNAGNALAMEAFVSVATELLKAQLLSAWPDLEAPTESGEDDDSNVVVCGISSHASSTEQSTADDDTCTSGSVHMVPPVAQEDLQLEGVAEQVSFNDKLLLPYVPLKETTRAVLHFAQGRALVQHNDAEDAISIPQSARPQVLLLHAEEGRGKSSFLAHIAAVLTNAPPIDTAGVVPPNRPASSAGTAVVVAFSFQAATVVSPVTCLRWCAASLILKFRLCDEFAVPSLEDDESGEAVATLLSELYAICSKRLRGTGTKLVLLFDGFDTVSAATKLLSFLPVLIPVRAPNNVLWVVATHSTSRFAAALRSRPTPPACLHLPDLSFKDRVLVVRQHLSLLGKTLQDSSTKGSFLKTLCKKTDAGMTTYLMLSLAFLNLFSKFDTLKQDIQRLPGTLPQLQAELLRRCETIYGQPSCVAVLTCLVLSNEIGGISEQDVYSTCGSHVAGASRLVAFLTSHGVVARSSDGANVLSMSASGALVSAVTKRYLSKTADVHRHHSRLLFGLLQTNPSDRNVSQSNSDGKDNDVPVTLGSLVQTLPMRSILAVLHHAMHAKRWSVVVRVCTHIETLIGIVAAGLLPGLLNLIETIKDLDRFTYRKLDAFAQFLIAHRHILLRRPYLARQAALNMPATSPVRQAARAAQLDLEACGSWTEWSNRHVHGEKECTQTSQWTTQPILCVALSSNGALMAVGGRDWCCRVGQVLDGTVVHQLKHPSDVVCAVFVANDNLLVTGCGAGVVRVWSMVDGALLQEGTGHARRINAVAAAGKERNLCLSASDDTTMMLWRVGSGAGGATKLRPFKTFRDHIGPVSCCAVHQGGLYVASGSWDGTVAINNNAADTNRSSMGGSAQRWASGHHGAAIRCLAFVPSMVVTLAIGSFNGAVDLYDVAGNVVSATFYEHAAPLSAMHISHDAKYMLSADASGTLRLWRQSVTGEIVGSLNGHAANVSAVLFHPTDANRCVSGSGDHTVRHWTFRNQGIDAPVGAVHSAGVTAMAAATNGSFVITACKSGTAHVFKASVLAAAEPWSTWFFIRPKPTVPDAARTPLCYVNVCAADTLIVLGDINGTISVWGAHPGLEGTDAPAKFTIADKLVHPIRSVTITHGASGAGWCAFTHGGESLQWTVNNEACATGNPDIVFVGGHRAVLASALTAPVVCAAMEPGDGSRSSGSSSTSGSSSACLEGIIVVTETSLHIASFDEDDGTVDVADAELEFSDLLSEIGIEMDGEVQCKAVAFNRDYLLAALRGGYLCIKPLSDAASAASDKPRVVRLRDDANRGRWLDINAIALSHGPGRNCLAACAGADMTVRIFSVGALGALRSVGVFHATAAITSMVFALPVLVVGDALGNVYSLVHHHHDDECDGNSNAPRTESIAASSALPDTSEGSTAPCSSDMPDEDDIDHLTLQFEELGRPMPAGARGLDRKQWMLRQRELLKTAAKMQRTVPAARLALRRHAQQAMRTFETFSALTSSS